MGELTYQDEYTWEDACSDQENELVPVFKDGKLLVTQSLAEIRNVLHKGQF